MSLRFVVQEGVADPRHDGPLLVPKRAHLPARGTGMLRAELHRLLLCRCLEGPREQGLDGRHGDVFHLGQIDVESGTVLAPVLPDDDFSPLFGQGVDLGEVLVVELARRHSASMFHLALMVRDALSPLHALKSTLPSKPVPALPHLHTPANSSGKAGRVGVSCSRSRRGSPLRVGRRRGCFVLPCRLFLLLRLSIPCER